MRVLMSIIPRMLLGKIRSDTLITFQHGMVEGASSLIGVSRLSDNKVALLLKETPFHPVNQRWPDQPGDQGVIRFPALKASAKVITSKTLAIHRETFEVNEVLSFSRKEADQWFYAVGHIVKQTDLPQDLEEGLSVTTHVDANYRGSLSLHHSASHLAALALNQATAKFWVKQADQRDSLGMINTDQLAIEKSSIFSDRSEETYRFGRSIQKKGFQVAEMFQQIHVIAEVMNGLISSWIRASADMEIDAQDGRLSSKRIWKCTLPQGKAAIPCGGTHLSGTHQFRNITVHLVPQEKDADKYLIATIRAEHIIS